MRTPIVSRQEAQHYRRHMDFNRAIFAHGYPGLEARVEMLKRDFEGFLANETDRFLIAYIEGFESFTTQFALRTLVDGARNGWKTVQQSLQGGGAVGSGPRAPVDDAPTAGYGP